MTHYASAKECLLKHGMIQEITRGRISAVNHKFLADRIAQGDTIGGYEAVVSSKPTGEVVHSNAKAPVSSEKIIADIGFPTRDEKEVQSHFFRDGKKVSVDIRTICSNCGASYTYCKCPNPEHWLDHNLRTPVYFERRVTPLKRQWW